MRSIRMFQFRKFIGSDTQAKTAPTPPSGFTLGLDVGTFIYRGPPMNIGRLRAYYWACYWPIQLFGDVQVLIVHFGSLAFSTAPLTIDQWLWCVLFGIGDLIWGQVVYVPVERSPQKPWNCCLQLIPDIFCKTIRTYSRSCEALGPGDRFSRLSDFFCVKNTTILKSPLCISRKGQALLLLDPVWNCNFPSGTVTELTLNLFVLCGNPAIVQGKYYTDPSHSALTWSWTLPSSL